MQLPLRLLVPIPLLAALGCGGGDLVLPPDGEPAQIVIVQGDQQTGSVGAPLADSLIVRLADQAGAGIPGRTVRWLVSSGGGSAAPVSTTTDSDGLASAQWILGPTPGPNTLDAVASGVGLVTFRATASGGSGGGPRLELIEGNNQSAPAGTRVPIRPAVRVVDEAGDPMAGFNVAFVVTGGGGSVTEAVRTTNPDGIARTDWQLGPSPGTNTLEARAGSIAGSPVVFTAEATGGGGGVVDHFVFEVQPRDVRRGEQFSVSVAMVDAGGSLVPLSGIEIYLGLFQDGSDVPSNRLLDGDRFRSTENGVAVFDLAVTRAGHYRLRALSDELPGLPPGSPQPPLFSNLFDVN